MHISTFSQLGQDLKVLEFYKHKKEGFFIEIGASDGIKMSNTYLLEKHYNWRGICVEPIQKIYNELRNNRPHSMCCNSAIYSRSGINVTFDVAINNDTLSGISKYISKYYKTKINSNKVQIIVKTLSFNDLLEKYNAPLFIDYLSLDTEGSELEILKSINFKKYIFGLIDVEHNYIEKTRMRIKKLLTSNGYVFIEENKWDDRYRHKTVFCVK